MTPETLLERNSFIIWRGDAPRRFRAEDGVSGFGRRQQRHQLSQQRGARRADALRGYQLDIDGQGEWTGQNYEERGRTFLALRGQISCVETGKKPYVVGSTGDKAKLFSQIDRDGWNECHVIARGHTLIHLINGHVMSGRRGRRPAGTYFRRTDRHAGTRRTADERSSSGISD